MHGAWEGRRLRVSVSVCVCVCCCLDRIVDRAAFLVSSYCVFFVLSFREEICGRLNGMRVALHDLPSLKHKLQQATAIWVLCQR